MALPAGIPTISCGLVTVTAAGEHTHVGAVWLYEGMATCSTHWSKAPGIPEGALELPMPAAVLAEFMEGEGECPEGGADCEYAREGEGAGAGEAAGAGTRTACSMQRSTQHALH